MKKLDLYLMKELMVPLLIGTVSVLLMFQANQLIYILRTFSVQNIPLPAILQLILYKTPYWASMTLPVGMSLAASLAISRITRESELTAMRANGARILRVIMPIAFFGALVSVGNFLLVEKVMPPSERAFNKLQTEVFSVGGLPTFNQNIGLKLKNWWVNFGSVQRGSAGNLILTDVILFERSQPGVTTIVQAKRGSFDRGNWVMTDTYAWVLNGQTLMSAKPGKPIIINQPMEISSLFGPPMPEEKTLTELREAIRSHKMSGMDSRAEEVQYYNRFALPAACLVFALVGPIFAVWFSRTGAFVGVLVSMILVLLYYNAWIISTEILGKNGWTTPWLASWLPNFIFIALGLLAIRRLE